MKLFSTSKKDSRGFTLIELLVVIAIIGILSAIVLASLNSARVKARDARVKETMHQMRNQAEIYYVTNGDYADGFYGYCSNAEVDSTDNIYKTTVDESIGILLQAVLDDLPNPSQNPVNGVMTDVACYSLPAWGAKADRWAVIVTLPSGDSTWCVDSMGYAGPATGVGSGFCTP